MANTDAAFLIDAEPSVLQVAVGRPQPNPAGTYEHTGIEKLPQAHIDILAQGPDYGDGSGVVGDTIGDDKHHGGADKAVYAFAREELDFWEGELGRELVYGSFGENITTAGVKWSEVYIGQRVSMGSAELEVSVPRTPCATFAAWLDEKGWVKRFAQHGDCGAYFRVITAGRIRPLDEIRFGPVPEHGVTMGEAFAAKLGNKEAARKVFDAGVLPGHHHEQLGRLLN